MACPNCGKVVEVPGTRHLRLLPLEGPGKGEGKNPRGAAQGLSLGFRLFMAGLLLFGSLSVAYGAWLALERWRAPIVFGHTEDEFFRSLYDESMADPIPRSWEHWNYLVEVGLPEQSEPLVYFQLSRYYETQWPWLVRSLVAGSIALAAFFGLSFLGTRRGTR